MVDGHVEHTFKVLGVLRSMVAQLQQGGFPRLGGTPDDHIPQPLHATHIISQNKRKARLKMADPVEKVDRLPEPFPEQKSLCSCEVW